MQVEHMFDVKDIGRGGYPDAMFFSGTIYFDYATFDVWRVYTTLLSASDRATVDVEWREFLVDEPDWSVPTTRLLAASAAVGSMHPMQHQRFAQAMLTLIFEQKDDPRSDTILHVAARVAGIDSEQVISAGENEGRSLLIAQSAEASELGVGAVPTIVRNGPPVHIRTTGAATQGNPVRRLEMIDAMLSDDGIWALTKP